MNTADDDADAPVRRMLTEWERERPDLDPEPMALFGRLSRADALAQQRIDAVLAGFGLQRGEFDVLATLRRAGDRGALTPGGLASAMLLSPAATTHRLGKLQSAGLITRGPDPADGRGSLVALTPGGREVVDRAVVAHVNGLEVALSGLPARDRAKLSELLGRLLVRLGDPPAAAPD